MPPAVSSGKGGYSLSQKRIAPFKFPKRKAWIGSLKLERAFCLRSESACQTFYTKRLDLLLSSLPLPHLNESLVESIIPANIPIEGN